jgi:hypothetical protein
MANKNSDADLSGQEGMLFGSRATAQGVTVALEHHHGDRAAQTIDHTEKAESSEAIVACVWSGAAPGSTARGGVRSADRSELNPAHWTLTVGFRLAQDL